ncbi:MAG: isopentenyl phosphate kinase [Candidatus Micrarchaeia archaeon]
MLAIIKIGGSAFSDKKSGKLYVGEVAERVARELPKGMQALIVQGAGSVGHMLAKRYSIYELKNNQNKWALLRYEVGKVSMEIAEALIKRGHAPIILSTPSFFSIKNGRISVSNLGILKAYIERGFIPILHSDGPLDDKKGLSILSGDDIAVELANRLAADLLIFGTDVPYLYGRNKKQVHEISRHTAPKLAFESSGIDVSGGMQKKLEKVSKVKRKTKVMLISLRKDGMLKASISGKRVGTLIY